MPELFKYSDKGQRGKTPLVFLHGFMGSSEDWNDIIDNMSKDYYCIAIDLPGHGNSPITENINQSNIDNTASAIVDFLKTSNIPKINLIGYSMGGRLAMFLALNFPGIIAKLVLESSTAGIIDPAERKLRLESDRKIAEEILSSDYNEFIEKWYSMPLFAAIKRSEYFPQLKKRRLGNNKENIAAALLQMSTGNMPSLWHLWEESNIPSLLLAGEYDDKYIQINRKLAKLNPKAVFKIINNSVHNTHFENKEMFVNYIRDFLKN